MRIIWTFILLILLSVEPDMGQAHPQFALSTVNRYGRLVLLPHRLILDYSLMVGEVPAQALLHAVDRNDDGQLDDAEQAQLRTQLQRTIERDVHLQLDGKPLSLRWSCQPLSLRSTRMEAAPFALEMSAEAELDNTPQPHQLIIDDRADLPPVGEVELRVEESPALNILFTHDGSTRADRVSADSASRPAIGTGQSAAAVSSVWTPALAALRSLSNDSLSATTASVHTESKALALPCDCDCAADTHRCRICDPQNPAKIVRCRASSPRVNPQRSAGSVQRLTDSSSAKVVPLGLVL
jgi:hypothetical protein